MLASPLGGPAGKDDNGDRVLAALARENVDTGACQRVDGLSTGLSAIFVDARGDRTIVTYRDKRIASVAPRDPETITAAPIWSSLTTDIRNSSARSFQKKNGPERLRLLMFAPAQKPCCLMPEIQLNEVDDG